MARRWCCCTARESSRPCWMRVIPDLVTTHRVVAPDLPGHGASEVADGQLDADRMVAWLGALIEHTCPSPPALVGHGLGGPIAARFAIAHPDRRRGWCWWTRSAWTDSSRHPVSRSPCTRFAEQPTEHTQDGLFRQCFVDLDGLRQQLGQRWEPLAAYALDLARTPGQAGRARQPHAGAGAAGDPAGGPGTDRRSHHHDLGTARPPGARCRSPRRPAPATAGRCT